MKFPDLHQHEQIYNFRYIIIIKNRRKFSIKKKHFYIPRNVKKVAKEQTKLWNGKILFVRFFGNIIFPVLFIAQFKFGRGDDE